ALGRITLDEEAEKAPDYAQGINKIIVKVLCGANITLALLVDGQLYISGTFKDQEGILGILPKKKFEQIFSKYIPASKFKISDIAVGENHVKQIAEGLHHTLVLQENGYVFSFGHSNYGSLGPSKISHDKKITFSTRIEKLENCNFIATGNFHSIAVDKEENIYIWGYGDTFAL
ncbi:46075_t:CDS:2, partial [Gigaspora margarita]